MRVLAFDVAMLYMLGTGLAPTRLALIRENMCTMVRLEYHGLVSSSTCG